MAGLFRFRRRASGRPDAGQATTAAGDIVPAAGGRHAGPAGAPGRGDAGVATADGQVHWVGVDESTAAGATPVAVAPATGSEGHERSDPTLAASQGMWEVIRPAAIVPEHAARRVLVELARRDLTNGGDWQSEPQLWSRFDGPLTGDGSTAPELMGTIHVTYGTPTKYEITLYRVTVTAAGVADGWTVASLTDEALGFGGLTLAECPRAMVNTPPRPYTF